MAATSDDFANPEVPTTMREFYMLYWHDRHNLNAKLDEIKESQGESDDVLANYMERINNWIKCHDADLSFNLRKLERHDEKIDQLEKRVTAWSLTNSIAAIIAAVMAFFGLKGS